ncbi:MAG: hypothetical protein WC527_05440 [Candidatus Margulisiibacteriota bacterium]
MEDLNCEEMSGVRLEGRADQAHLETVNNSGEMCPYFEKVKCHFPRLSYGFCSGCPRLMPENLLTKAAPSINIVE